MNQRSEYITVKQAKEELGNEAYFAFHRWLVEKGYRNLDEIYVTRDQLQEFIKETALSSRGNLPTHALWGQTREHWSGYRDIKRKKK